MKFSKKIPKKSGWYWVVDVEYPAPKLVFIQDEYMWDWGTKYFLGCEDFKYIRFGEEVVPPDCKENVIE